MIVRISSCYVTKFMPRRATTLLLVAMVFGGAGINAQESPREQFVELVTAQLISKGILEEKDLNLSQLNCAVGELYDRMSDEQKGLSQLVTEQAKATPERHPLEVDSEISETYDPDREIRSTISSLASDSLKDEINKACGVQFFD